MDLCSIAILPLWNDNVISRNDIIELLFMISNSRKYSESREKSQTCLSFSEAYLIIWKYSESREENQVHLNFSVKREQNEFTRFAERRKSLTC